MDERECMFVQQSNLTLCCLTFTPTDNQFIDNFTRKFDLSDFFL